MFYIQSYLFRYVDNDLKHARMDFRQNHKDQQTFEKFDI